MNLLDFMPFRQKPDPTRGTGHVFNAYGQNNAPHRQQQGGGWMNKPALGGSMSRGDLLLASMGMLSGRNFQEGMANAGQYMAYGMDRANERQKEQQQKAALAKAMQGMDLTPQQRALMGINPGGVTNALTERAFAQPAAPTYMKSGEDIIALQGDRASTVYDAPDAAPEKYADVSPSELPPGTPPGLYKRNLATNEIERVAGPQSAGVTVNTGDMPSKSNLTPLQLKMDEKYADTLAEWNTGGGPDVIKNLTQITDVAKVLESGEGNYTGALLGLTPDWVLAGINPEAINQRELVEEVVQRNLRVTLGAQFTAKEGDNLIKRAYNRNLPEAMNAARLRRLAQLIEGRAQQLQSLNQYMLQNGTSAGWDGSLMTADQMLADLDAVSGGANSPAKGQVRRRWNPETQTFEVAQ